MRNDSSGDRRGVWGRLLTLLLAVGVALAVSAALLRVLGTGAGRWNFTALAFTPFALAGAVALLLLGLATRRRVSCAGAAVAVVVLAAGVLPRAFADARAVVDLVRSRHVDVLSVQELTPRAVDALGAAGLWTLLPHGSCARNRGPPGPGWCPATRCGSAPPARRRPTTGSRPP